MPAYSGAHNFCLAHLREWISRNLPSPGCPTCREPIQADVTKLRARLEKDEDPEAKRLFDQLLAHMSKAKADEPQKEEDGGQGCEGT